MRKRVSPGLFHTLMSSICVFSSHPRCSQLHLGVHTQPALGLVAPCTQAAPQTPHPILRTPEPASTRAGRSSEGAQQGLRRMKDLRHNRQITPLGDADLPYPPSLLRQTGRYAEGARESAHQPASVPGR